MKDTKSKKNIRALEGVFWWRASLDCVLISILRLEYFFINILHFLHLFINIFVLSNPKITFSPSIKGFEYLKGVWQVHFISQIHLLFIDHHYFLNLKLPKLFLDFNLWILISMDSTSLATFLNFKTEFEELSIIFDTWTWVFNDHNFIHITYVYAKSCIAQIWEALVGKIPLI